MKAIVYREYGAANVLHVDDVEKPTPANDQVLIKVHAVEATKADCEMRSFNFAVGWFWLPLRIGLGVFRPRNPVLGNYFSGVIEAVGCDVSDYEAGQKVFGATGLRMGAYAEYLCVAGSATIATMPHNMTFAEAAAVPLGGFNALHYMRKAGIRRGEKVLINGAGASIGTFAVQIAKAMGAEVTAVDSGIKGAMLTDIGADHVIDYNEVDFSDSGNTYDVIFSMVAATSYSKCVRALKPNGRYVMANPKLSDMLRSPVTTRFSDKKVLFAFAGEKMEELLELRRLIEAGDVAATVDKIFSMEQATEAHTRVETERRLGTVVISMEYQQQQ
ncbi:MAG: NAD(P)-dependent alcohol dehydrogenase [Gammaproteobacteria bacterium]|nr:NAD(P)-dependent alcohol dehydrogenase [Gammaproteobacteria bacterium]